MDTAQTSRCSLASDEATVDTGEKVDGTRIRQRARVEVSSKRTRALVELRGVSHMNEAFLVKYFRELGLGAVNILTLRVLRPFSSLSAI